MENSIVLACYAFQTDKINVLIYSQFLLVYFRNFKTASKSEA